MLLGVLGLHSVVLADSASYLASGALLVLASIPAAPDDASSSGTPSLGSAWSAFWRLWLDGLRQVLRKRWLATLFGIMGAAAVAQGIINVLLVVFVSHILHGDARTFGWMVSAQGVGGLAAGLVIAQIGHTLAPTRLLALSLGAVGLIFLILVNVPLIALALALLAAVGVPLMGWLTSASALLQAGVPDRYRGRIFGAYGATQATSMLAGMGLASALNARLGVVALLNIAGLLLLIAGAGALTLAAPKLAPATMR